MNMNHHLSNRDSHSTNFARGQGLADTRIREWSSDEPPLRRQASRDAGSHCSPNNWGHIKLERTSSLG